MSVVRWSRKGTLFYVVVTWLLTTTYNENVHKILLDHALLYIIKKGAANAEMDSKISEKKRKPSSSC